ncbi:GCG_CRPN prefix-to-repeats domain-containing protein [Mesorhizobium koreense]|jgi:hypothetical protein|uniref:GCG_CRPN prefix-to-repeats domain-containing protein n=1 Tax=Mesorhizobium koreense TaxID=3074855 RepID=UPI00352FF61F
MRSSILCLTAAFSLMLAVPGVASAGVMAPVAQASTAAASVGGDLPLVLVAGGCGAGFHRGAYGRCRPNVAPRYPVRHVKRCVRRWTHYGWRTVCRYY